MGRKHLVKSGKMAQRYLQQTGKRATYVIKQQNNWQNYSL